MRIHNDSKQPSCVLILIYILAITSLTMLPLFHSSLVSGLTGAESSQRETNCHFLTATFDLLLLWKQYEALIISGLSACKETLLDISHSVQRVASQMRGATGALINICKVSWAPRKRQAQLHRRQR